MIKRPKPGEDEDDILRMQEEFLRERAKNQNLQPAAQVVNLRRTEPIKRATNNQTGSRKPSKYAQTKGLKNHGEKRVKFEEDESVIGEILEKNVEDIKLDFRNSFDTMPKQNELVDKKYSPSEAGNDKVYYPKIIPSILGNIVEKNVIDFDLNWKPMPAEGFPTVTKQDPDITDRKIINHKSVNTLKTDTNMDIDDPTTSNMYKNNKINLPNRSYIVSAKEATEIHNENVKLLCKMSEIEILEEQKKFISSLDSKLIDFIKTKRKNANSKQISSKSCHMNMDINETILNSDNGNRDKSSTDEKMPEAQMLIKPKKQLIEFSNPQDDSLWENDVLSHPDINKWLHFDSLEKDKLQWMKGIEERKEIKSDEPYEARFDFRGYLLPYTIELTEKTKPLFHHGEEPHRPGYSLTEIFELTRSTIIQQRVMALNTIAGILDYYNSGIYKDIIDIPLSKILFIVRISMDENKVIILEPALKAMRNLIYNRIDEASLDALIGFDEGTNQPCLENDKSEIEELESEETELKDFHLAEIDIIAALLRTDILQRLFYILETVRPSFNSVHYCLQILTRLARDSVDTARRIVEKEHLMKTIIHNFVPNTGINFVFEPQIVYNGKPILAAMKLLRVLTLQSDDISNMLVMKYDIIKPVSIYISSAVDRSYGLRIQVEAFCILSNLLDYGFGVDSCDSLYPIVVTALYKHVQGTDIFITSSIISATHCAVVLQFIKKYLCCTVHSKDSIKSQIYPLLIDGTRKWLTQLSQSDNYTCGHLRLLCSALDCCKTVILSENVAATFLNNALKTLSLSTGFQKIVENLIPSSNLLSGIEDKDLHIVMNHMSLGSSVIDSTQKVLPVLNVASPIPFLSSLFDLLSYLNDKKIQESYLNHLTVYLKKLVQKTPSLCDNWFTRMETNLVVYAIKLAIQVDLPESEKDLLYVVANKLCYILRIDKKWELDILFNCIVFNKYWLTAERLLNLVNLSDADGFSKALTSIGDIKECYSRVVNLNYKNAGHNVVLRRWKEPILPRDWLYLPILMLYSKSQETEALKIEGAHAMHVATHISTEKQFIITCSLEWILFNELCFPDILKDIDITDRFCRIMCVFLCDNSLFLDSNIKILLRKCTRILFQQRGTFNFDKQLVGLNNFEDFFTQFLEQFQSVSYGDHTFAACVLVPLAQRHNVKWRKVLWSEYAGCLRALDCPEEFLCYDLQEYFYPLETDESLIKSYIQALSSNLLRQGTIAYKIAKHHVEYFRNKPNSCT